MIAPQIRPYKALHLEISDGLVRGRKQETGGNRIYMGKHRELCHATLQPGLIGILRSKSKYKLGNNKWDYTIIFFLLARKMAPSYAKAAERANEDELDTLMSADELYDRRSQSGNHTISSPEHTPKADPLVFRRPEEFDGVSDVIPSRSRLHDRLGDLGATWFHRRTWYSPSYIDRRKPNSHGQTPRIVSCNLASRPDRNPAI